ncbi:MFS transporter, DHA1 family, bicyclomycin/chloramphenicol resistance protein [Pedococcus dokdonensis]|uniref:MFS transporter, DHA1 family, bicyclomycin/chloramphenicol resistance protein n=1 Tax=Pedococcus dokdonensis TaxID=443156 RepID=A0A1H0Q905_9MICO|nr:multidrug effflux MFS transporter [Pedococcus dokdonensis]SDP13804.1 MFS transporter, DHA1 family, bicyclomycin/chloramphenicol resistance protein [Pedococcus dokdonensis]
MTAAPDTLETTSPVVPPQAAETAVAPAPATPEPPEAPTGRSYVRFVLVLGALIAIGPLTIDTYLPALPSITRDLAASESAVQGTLTGILLGMGLGQLLVGPLADAVGRRRPLIAGLALHIAASVFCAFAPSIELLTAGRAVQGLGNAAVAVVSMAMVRDLFAGSAAATMLSRLMLVMGLAPVLAPTLGGFILQLTSWRGVFVILAVAGVLMVTLASLALRETLPVERRRPLAARAVLSTYAGLLRDRTFVGLVLISGLMFATLFSYIGGSSFVLQDIYGLTVAQFGLAFGVNSLGFLSGSQLNPFLLKRYAPRQLVRVGVSIGATAALVLLASAATGFGGLVLILVPLWFLLFACGLTLPNTPALALTRHGEAAGTAAALLGASQFVIGGAAAPVIGLMGSDSAVPMALVMATTASLAALVAARTLRVAVVSA